MSPGLSTICHPISVGLSTTGAYMGGCQNSGPFLDPYHNTAPNI